MLSISDIILIALFSIIGLFYEMITRDILTIEMLQGIFSGNVIIYIFLVGVFLILRKYLSPAPAKSQVAKLEKTVLALNNEIQKMKGEAEWERVSQGKKHSSFSDLPVIFFHIISKVKRY